MTKHIPGHQNLLSIKGGSYNVKTSRYYDWMLQKIHDYCVSDYNFQMNKPTFKVILNIFLYLIHEKYTDRRNSSVMRTLLFSHISNAP